MKNLQANDKKPKVDFSTLSVGDSFIFGDYYGPIKWRVLNKNADSLFVISEFGLDAKPFVKEGYTSDWHDCSLKEWLNTEFFNKAFSSEEKSLIEDTPYGKAFLLSTDEAEEFLESSSERRCKPTSYALSQGAFPYQGAFLYQGYCEWWLRLSDDDDYDAVCVLADGNFYFTGYYKDFASAAVRPAICIKLQYQY